MGIPTRLEVLFLRFFFGVRTKVDGDTVRVFVPKRSEAIVARLIDDLKRDAWLDGNDPPVVTERDGETTIVGRKRTAVIRVG